MRHGLACFARLVRLLLGHSSIAEAKLDYGRDLCILGIDVSTSLRGYQCQPSPDKVRKWLTAIDNALTSMKLPQGEASKLAGKLSWGCSALFRRFGRAMLRPVFDQVSRRDGRVDPELKRALEWWKRVLSAGLAETRDWVESEGTPAQLFCDASGHPAHLGAVLFIDNRCWWSHPSVSSNVLSRFKSRKDNQIMGMELLAISLGLCTFDWLIQGRTVVVHCDNTGSEACFIHSLHPASLHCAVVQASIRRGTARSWDHAQLVHEQWLQAALANTCLVKQRAPRMTTSPICHRVRSVSLITSERIRSVLMAVTFAGI